MDFQAMSIDMCSVDICYDPFVRSIQERLDLICTGLNLKSVLEERGKLMQLDKIRNLSTKLRGVSECEL